MHMFFMQIIDIFCRFRDHFEVSYRPSFDDESATIHTIKTGRNENEALRKYTGKHYLTGPSTIK